MSNQPNRKNEEVRRANRTIQTRTFILMLVLGVGLFVLLFFKLYQLQIVRHEELQELAVDQQTRSNVVTASRGTIYDRNGNILAISATAETVFLSPKELNEELAKEETAWTKDFLAENLAKILDINAESILKKMERTNSQYEIIKLRADEDVANQVRQFINDNKIRGVYLVTDAKRYYPYSTLACHVIGFVGNDNVGLYGLEARYENELEGQTGLVVTAKNGAGTDMLYEYERYYDAKNGDDLVLTLDSTVQYYLEKGIEEMADKFDAANGATGVVMNAKTGAILGMASYPNYDLNDFSTLQDGKLKSAVKNGKASLGDMQLRQWRNKALNDTYEPGSTFKVLTLSAALEEGVINENTTFNCSGSIHVLDANIHCSNTSGHGHETLKETVGNSCNPAFITYGLRLGNEKFYEYMKNFGLMDETGVDLDGEATGIFMEPDKFSKLDLAYYAFGQNFNVTPIALIAAQAACINGGYLHSPYVVEQVQDDGGNVVYQHDDTPIRQVISEETSAQVRDILESVVSGPGGTGKNAYVPGYRIGGKTGSSQNIDSVDHITVSFAGFAPADDPEIVVLLAYDWPRPAVHEGNTTAGGVYISGGNMAAPMAGELIANILDYLGYTKTVDNTAGGVTVPDLRGSTVEETAAALSSLNLNYRTSGEGGFVTDQIPTAGSSIPKGSTIVLYLGTERVIQTAEMPNLGGMTYESAVAAMEERGLYLTGTGTSPEGRVFRQTVDPGAVLDVGTVVEVQFADTVGIDELGANWSEWKWANQEEAQAQQETPNE